MKLAAWQQVKLDLLDAQAEAIDMAIGYVELIEPIYEGKRRQQVKVFVSELRLDADNLRKTAAALSENTVADDVVVDLRVGERDA